MRLVLAQQSKDRKAQEQARIKAENAAMKAKLAMKNVEQRTDDDIDDEEAGRMRKVLAEQSRQRRLAEQKAAAAHAAALKRRNKDTAQRTDDDLMDEAAGRARLEMAAASRQFRAESAKYLAEKNEQMRQRLNAAQPKIYSPTPHSPSAGMVTADDVAAAAAAVEAARRATQDARDRARKALTEDQRLLRAKGMRRQLADLSKRTAISPASGGSSRVNSVREPALAS